MQFRFNNSGRGFLSAIPPVTRNIIIINFLIWIISELRPDFMYETFALFYPKSQYFHWWQFVTHMFMHGGFWHIFFNMYTLLMFGIILERSLGSQRFLIFYFVTGLGAAALHTGVEWIQATMFLSNNAIANYHQLLMTPTLGASGAIYGVLIGYAMLYPQSRLTLLFPPITLTAKWFVIIFAVIELFTGITGFQDGIAHFAHLGGMLFGWLLIMWWRKKGRLY